MEAALAVFSTAGARRLGNGELQRSVVSALRAASQPLRIAEVRLAVERRLLKPVSTSSVNACMSAGARQTGRFERVAAGVYRIADEASGSVSGS